MGVFKDYEKAVWDVEHNNCTLGELEAAEKRLKDSIVEWHPFPKEKPDSDRICLVTINVCNRGVYGVDVGWFAESNWHSVDELYCNDEITAWAEMPKPYEEGAEE